MQRPGGWRARGILLFALSGCGGAIAPPLGDGDGGTVAVGSVSASMQLPAGTFAGSGTYTLTGPGSFLRHLTLPLDGASQITFVIDALPSASEGYNLDVEVTSLDGLSDCDSSVQFGVDESSTTTVTLIPHCSAPSQAVPSSG